jgi:hypothetical protein
MTSQALIGCAPSSSTPSLRGRRCICCPLLSSRTVVDHWECWRLFCRGSRFCAPIQCAQSLALHTCSDFWDCSDDDTPNTACLGINPHDAHSHDSTTAGGRTPLPRSLALARCCHAVAIARSKAKLTNTPWTAQEPRPSRRSRMKSYIRARDVVRYAQPLFCSIHSTACSR